MSSWLTFVFLVLLYYHTFEGATQVPKTVRERPKQVIKEMTSSKSTSSFFASLRAPLVTPEDNAIPPTNLQHVELPSLGIQYCETNSQTYHVLLPTLHSPVQIKSEVWGKTVIISITNSIPGLRSTN